MRAIVRSIHASVRDTNLTLEAMLRLGFEDQLHTSAPTVLAVQQRPEDRGPASEGRYSQSIEPSRATSAAVRLLPTTA